VEEREPAFSDIGCCPKYWKVKKGETVTVTVSIKLESDLDQQKNNQCVFCSKKISRVLNNLKKSYLKKDIKKIINKTFFNQQ
jgi:hypothetical protein